MTYQFHLTEMEFRLFRDFIHEKFGIYLKEEKRSFLQMKLYPRVVTLGLRTFSEYLQFVKYGPQGARELMRMISFLTNNETYFFREASQLNVFRNVLIYFSKDKVKTVINNFSHALGRGGYLLLGHSETLTGIGNDFEAKRFPETIIYQKKEQ